MLTERAKLTLWELGITEDVVLERIHCGLIAGPSEIKSAEARSVTRRLAELLEWDCPSFDADAEGHG